MHTPLDTSHEVASPFRSALSDWGGRSQLTPREFDLVIELCASNPNKVIARRLGISVSTVASELKVLFKRLGVQSRAELVSQCFRHALRE